jgi:two-component system chemotaxis response regulator CheB
VAKEAGNRAIGVILTGMGCDGAKGLLSMKKNGAYTIGQDEASSVVYGMPKVAFELGAVIKQTSLNNIPQALLAALKER